MSHVTHQLVAVEPVDRSSWMIQAVIVGLRHWWVIHNYVIFSSYVMCAQQHTYNAIQITHCAC